MTLWIWAAILGGGVISTCLNYLLIRHDRRILVDQIKRQESAMAWLEHQGYIDHRAKRHLSDHFARSPDDANHLRRAIRKVLRSDRS